MLYMDSCTAQYLTISEVFIPKVRVWVTTVLLLSIQKETQNNSLKNESNHICNFTFRSVHVCNTYRRRRNSNSKNNCAFSPKCLIAPRCGPEEEPFFDKDENGCNIDCGRCVPKHRPCPAVRCSRYCPYGYKVDSRGYQTCECKCPSITCKIYCKYGHEIDPETKCPLQV
jgi:hypothetical protein